MNHPKANRLRLCLTLAVVAAFAAILPAGANADYKNGYPKLSVQFENATPGAHSDITITHTYSESTPGADPPNPALWGYEGVASGAPGTTGDDLKQWILDTPAGFVGNPNAVPFAERCTVAQMNNYVKGSVAPGQPPFNSASPCPTSAIVGDAQLTLGVDANGKTAAVLNGTIYIVQSEDPFQEVPTTLFTVFTSVIPSGPAAGQNAVAALSKTQIAPVTTGAQGGFQLRSVSEGPIDRPDLSAALGQAPGTTFGHIQKIYQHLEGVLTNGNAFQTNPVRCEPWDSTLYTSTYGTGANGTASQTSTLEGTAVNGGDTSDSYNAVSATATDPDCSSKPPFEATISATLSTNTRDSNPEFSVTVSNPNAPGVDVPKDVTTTLPSTITTDLQNSALSNLCSASDAAVGNCAAAAKVGSAKIETPMLVAGLTGDVYAVKGSSAVPDLLVNIAGPSNALNIRMLGHSKFVGPNGDQIQTTFTDAPQTPFTKYTLTIAGGTNSLLTISACPPTNPPADGPIQYSMTSYGGNAKSQETATAFPGCFGKPVVKKVRKCVKKKLKVNPSGLLYPTNISKVELQAGKKRLKTIKRDKSNPFRFNVKLSKKKFKKGQKYLFRARVVYKPTADYPNGKVIYSKKSSFRMCK